MTEIQSVLLYGAKMWADALNRKVYRKRLSQVQRRGPLRVVSAYRTVSEAAVMVIAGVIPINVYAKERRAVHLKKNEVSKEITKQQENLRTL